MNELRYDIEPGAYPPELPDAIYYPSKTLPEARILNYADACVQVVLNQSEAAKRLYSFIVKAWGLPGCQPLISEFRRCIPDTGNHLDQILRAIPDTNQTPKRLQEAIAKLDLEHNTDYQKLLNCISFFIIAFFNRRSDLGNDKPKIVPKSCPYLFQAIHIESLLEYYQRLKQMDRENGRIKEEGDSPYHQLGGQLFHFAVLMATDHTTRKERELKQKAVSGLREMRFSLRHSQKTLDGAEMWYRARVLCNTASEAADYYRIDATDLSKRIEPYDDATGWPRHK